MVIFSGCSNTFDYMSVYTTKVIWLDAFSTTSEVDKLKNVQTLFSTALCTCDQINITTPEYQV